MTSLIGAGISARKRAMAGFGAAADMEAKEIRNIEALAAAGKAQDMQTMGTGAGFGAMVGMNKAMGARAAAQEIGKQAGAEATKQFLAANVAEGATATAAQTAAAAKAGAAAQGTATAAATPSTLATIGTLATPIAIGLGAAYLITKLFD